jgi:hypothetical protein
VIVVEKRKNYYTGAGLAIGTGIGGAIAMTAYAITSNPVFIAFTGVGTAFGLVFGSALDAKNNKKKNDLKE